MRATFKIENPEDAMCTMNVTMPLRDWEALQTQLGAKYPAWAFSSLVTALVSQARSKFHAEEEKST